ncbi:MAG: 4Fe-4S dicluster domain-containing protein [Gammaproteobacteria bacterium]|nr:4Fe-4S dicluster domain-containing protein [Gammaproteobacteria bacterium]MBU1980162.1 4Fe-4S dicluster domain-containing protein [Gammaproteobacteria bacterium]
MSDPPSHPQEKLPDPLVDVAARCVSCGLCLPRCPTYRKTLNEADSPRGRIVLMQGVLEQRIPANERFLAHIDLCLACRACESVCPNNVEYGRLINGVRGVVEKTRQRSLWQLMGRRVLMDGVATKPAMLRLVGGVLRTCQAMLGQAGWLMRSPLAQIATRLPRLRPQPIWKAIYPAAGKERGEVGLFLGCVARVLDVETLTASIFVLNRLGYTVHVPSRQGCCGAMHAGLGEPEKVSEFEEQNLRAFAGMNLEAVISTATGCGAALKNYPQDFAGRVKDISEFLGEAEGWESAEIEPLAEKLVVHEPCLMRNVLHCQGKPYDLLHRIPGAEVVPLAGNDQCCGAAGTYFLTQPEMAASLLADKIEAVKASGAQILATSNIGCAMHLAAGLKASGIELEVVHPITLLARQMGFQNDKN